MLALTDPAWVMLHYIMLLTTVGLKRRAGLAVCRRSAAGWPCALCCPSPGFRSLTAAFRPHRSPVSRRPLVDSETLPVRTHRPPDALKSPVEGAEGEGVAQEPKKKSKKDKKEKEKRKSKERKVSVCFCSACFWIVLGLLLV